MAEIVDLPNLNLVIFQDSIVMFVFHEMYDFPNLKHHWINRASPWTGLPHEFSS